MKNKMRQRRFVGQFSEGHELGPVRTPNVRLFIAFSKIYRRPLTVTLAKSLLQQVGAFHLRGVPYTRGGKQSGKEMQFLHVGQLFLVTKRNICAK